ncbi:MAG: endonuclease/exonuclease/phosphatase family protein [Actinobacteria bacterium]|nr:endonuclease/exonuclease/phosphatase family protein [Actinomycetota bacterium]
MTVMTRASLKFGTAGALAVLLATTTLAGATASEAAVPAAAVVPAADTDASTISLKVATYNIHKSSSGPSWSGRRDDVRDTILGQDPDVLALEEATPNRIGGVRQYDDILDLIDNSTDYKYVEAAAYTSGTKLAYDSGRFSVSDSGTKILKKKGSQRRYAVWAILKDISSGKKFFAVATHLEPGGASSKLNSVRITQAKQIIALIKDNNNGYPVVILGDMNSSRSIKPYNGQYLAFTRAGYIDPLDNPKPNSAAGANAIAQTMVDVNFNSANKFHRNAPKAPASWKVGTNVDYIYVSSGVSVTRFQTVVDVDSDGQFIGTIPSDHNMLVATVRI